MEMASGATFPNLSANSFSFRIELAGPNRRTGDHSVELDLYVDFPGMERVPLDFLKMRTREDRKWRYSSAYARVAFFAIKDDVHGSINDGDLFMQVECLDGRKSEVRRFTAPDDVEPVDLMQVFADEIRRQLEEENKED